MGSSTGPAVTVMSSVVKSRTTLTQVSMLHDNMQQGATRSGWRLAVLVANGGLSRLSSRLTIIDLQPGVLVGMGLADRLPRNDSPSNPRPGHLPQPTQETRKTRWLWFVVMAANAEPTKQCTTAHSLPADGLAQSTSAFGPVPVD
ncbi:hypothetical protein NM208_g11388 [Fusarium decemcellulare]|uniref:Uncharacterized protein n=1 Tax=Fusarium decemcellulare TaxID=57161 RepID=A0ACC1RUR7_9HYPO|nr:hypothetical protein NM208_g11388 [Fusarium decemcellulare]